MFTTRISPIATIVAILLCVAYSTQAASAKEIMVCTDAGGEPKVNPNLTSGGNIGLTGANSALSCETDNAERLVPGGLAQLYREGWQLISVGSAGGAHGLIAYLHRDKTASK